MNSFRRYFSERNLLSHPFLFFYIPPYLLKAKTEIQRGVEYFKNILKDKGLLNKATIHRWYSIKNTKIHTVGLNR